MPTTIGGERWPPISMPVRPIPLVDRILRRDAIGESTVFWRRESDGSVRAAHRPAELARSGDGISLAALRNYLSCAFVPGSDSLHAGIQELRPGVEWDPEVEPEPREVEPLREGAWDPEAPIHEHAARLRPLLESAVARRLPTDPTEPVGVFLSGGLDSSLVAALVRRLHPGPVHTFSLHFGEPYANELPFSQAVADHLATKHHVLEFDEPTILAAFPASIAALDDPIGDPLTTPNFLMARAARAAGIRTVFNGEGGDPVFGGPKNLPMVLHSMYDDGTDDVRTAYFRSFAKCHDDLPRLWRPEVAAEVARLAPQEELLTPFLRDDGNPMRSYLNRLMRINVRLKGADHILAKVANLTSHHGLRAASPLFDPEIVEAGFAIPPRCKLDGTREKAVLKDAVADLLPTPVVERPKSGMMVPVQKWFRGPMARFARDLLLDRRARYRRWLEPEPIREWLEYRPLPQPRHGVRIWLIATLELWLRENGK
ncbi:MAG: asparagine synthetase B family protein [Armatimonadota bacterium]